MTIAIICLNPNLQANLLLGEMVSNLILSATVVMLYCFTIHSSLKDKGAVVSGGLLLTSVIMHCISVYFYIRTREAGEIIQLLEVLATALLSTHMVVDHYHL